MVGNYCYSGIDYGRMGDVLEPKGLRSFYGYGVSTGSSYTVSNELCWRAEDTIITNLIRLDTTGIAHLANNKNLLEDTTTWNFWPKSRKKLLAEKYFVFGPQTLNHYLDKGYQFENKCGDSLIDSRDGKIYKTVCIGEQEWMAENLNWAGAGVCFGDEAAKCKTYGRLYNWTEASNVYPVDWHLPSQSELMELLNNLGGEAKSGGKLKSTTSDWLAPNTGANNSSGFSALPGGLKVAPPTGSFSSLGRNAFFWTKTTDNSSPTKYFWFRLSYDHAEVEYGFALGEPHYSVRCLKD